MFGVRSIRGRSASSAAAQRERWELTTTPTCPSQLAFQALAPLCSIFTLSCCSDAAVASTDMKHLSLVALAANLASVQSEGLDIDAVNPKIVEAK